jgi:hypothetical protein
MSARYVQSNLMIMVKMAKLVLFASDYGANHECLGGADHVVDQEHEQARW